MSDKPEAFKLPEQNTTMTLSEFGVALLNANNLGRELTLEHQSLYGMEKGDAKTNKGGKRFHAAGIMKDCPHCKKIINAHDAYMHLQAEQIGMTGIPFESLMSAIKITRAVVKMMKNGGEL